MLGARAYRAMSRRWRQCELYVHPLILPTFARSSFQNEKGRIKMADADARMGEYSFSVPNRIIEQT